MRGKKKVIIGVIFLLVIILTGFIYKVVSSKEFCCSGIGTVSKENIQKLETFNCKEETIILNIDVELLSGTVSPNDKGECSLSPTIEEVKKDPNFNVTKDQGEIEVNIYDNDTSDIVDSFIVKSGERKSHYSFLKSNSSYIVKIKSRSFIGVCEYKCYKYVI